MQVERVAKKSKDNTQVVKRIPTTSDDEYVEFDARLNTNSDWADAERRDEPWLTPNIRISLIKNSDNDQIIQYEMVTPVRQDESWPKLKINTSSKNLQSMNLSPSVERFKLDSPSQSVSISDVNSKPEEENSIPKINEFKEDSSKNILYRNTEDHATLSQFNKKWYVLLVGKVLNFVYYNVNEKYSIISPSSV